MHDIIQIWRLHDIIQTWRLHDIIQIWRLHDIIQIWRLHDIIQILNFVSQRDERWKDSWNISQKNFSRNLKFYLCSGPAICVLLPPLGAHPIHKDLKGILDVISSDPSSKQRAVYPILKIPFKPFLVLSRLNVISLLIYLKIDYFCEFANKVICVFMVQRSWSKLS